MQSDQVHLQFLKKTGSLYIWGGGGGGGVGWRDGAG